MTNAAPAPATLALAGVLLALPAVAELTPQEERGKHIYLRGESVTGSEVTAVMGETEVEVPASLVPCGSCHGRDGRGRPEGGIYPANLTWAALTKPYGLDHPSGRQHEAYTERTLKRAFTMGIDPAGNHLHVAMPRYRMTLADADDLIAYVKRLGEDLDPGLSKDSIRLATLVPRQGPLASMGAAVEAVLRARFDELNQQGGVYHRRLELEVADAPQEAAARAGATRELLEAGDTFALVAAFLPGAELEVTAVLEELETPLVGPFTSYPQIDFFAPNPWVFYVLPGVEDLGRTLVRFAHDQAGDETPQAAVVRDGEALLEGPADEIADLVEELGWPAAKTAVLNGDGADVAGLREAAVDLVVLLSSGDLQGAFLAEAAAADWFPRVLIPGTMAGGAVFTAPAGFDRRIYLAFPTLPESRDPRGLPGYRELAERYRLPGDHVAAQIAALAAAEVLIEGLKQTGRGLSRGGLVEALEEVYELETRLVPPVTYGPNRRIGIRGGYVSTVDLERRTLLPVSDWIEAE
jgi:ABC-type branched-subunit amino acid transport system substrate-binding protein